MSNYTREKDISGVPLHGGRFATPAHSEPPADTLTKGVQERFDQTMAMDDLEVTQAATSPDRFPPIMVTVTLEQWQNDYAVPLHDIEFDATAILNTYTSDELSEIEDHSSEGDDIFHEAVRQGLVADHDGPFEVHVRSAIDGALEAHPDRFDAKSRQVELAAGEQEDYDELADGEVIEQIAVSRSEDGETATIDATKRLNLVDLAPSDLNYNEKQEWLAFNGPATAAFFRERYGADLADGEEGFEEIYATTSKNVPFEGLTPVGIADAAWESGINRIHNEYDNGTFGTENMDRLLQEACSEPPVIPEPSPDTILSMANGVASTFAMAADIQKPPSSPGWKREYNRYTGEYKTTTPDGDDWYYSVAP